MGDTALRVNRAALREAAAMLKQVGGSVIDGAAVSPSAIDAAAAGMHEGVAAAVADVFDRWLGSLADGGQTIERLGWVLDDAALSYSETEEAIARGLSVPRPR